MLVRQAALGLLGFSLRHLDPALNPPDLFRVGLVVGRRLGLALPVQLGRRLSLAAQTLRLTLVAALGLPVGLLCELPLEVAQAVHFRRLRSQSPGPSLIRRGQLAIERCQPGGGCRMLRLQRRADPLLFAISPQGAPALRVAQLQRRLGLGLEQIQLPPLGLELVNTALDGAECCIQRTAHGAADQQPEGELIGRHRILCRLKVAQSLSHQIMRANGMASISATEKWNSAARRLAMRLWC